MQSWSYGLWESERGHQWVPWSFPHCFSCHRWSSEFLSLFSPRKKERKNKEFYIWCVGSWCEQWQSFPPTKLKVVPLYQSMVFRDCLSDQAKWWLYLLIFEGRDGGTSREWNKECDNSSGWGQSPESGVHIIDWSSVHGPQQEPRSSCGRELLEWSWILQEHQGLPTYFFFFNTIYP